MPGPDREFMSQEATPNQLGREAEISEAKKYSRTRPYHSGAAATLEHRRNQTVHPFRRSYKLDIRLHNFLRHV